MTVIEKNEGPKIEYEVIGSKIIFDDDLMLNLAKREADEPVHIVISRNKARELVIGTEDLYRYVAEIDIPARAYTEPENEGDAPEPVPFDMDNVTLTLWAVE